MWKHVRMAQKIPVPPELPQLAAQTSPQRPWPLRVLSMKIREYVAAMSRLWVEGEVITLQRRPGARVQFFTLRDLEAKASMSVKISTHLLPLGVEPGTRVVVCAKPDFYEANGSLSLWADEVRPVGVGDILARLEQLRARLAAEGLFAAERKKRLPFLPRTIGLICGRNTKAKEDVVVNARTRWPAVGFDVREVQVQGSGAVDAMLQALSELEAAPGVDVIVLARGGGSVEDLLPFSDERTPSLPSSRPSAMKATARFSTWSPTCAPPRPRTRPSESSPTSPRRRRASCKPCDGDGRPSPRCSTAPEPT